MEIVSGVQVGPRKIMIYGRHGTGKSSWAASAPKPLFLTFEEGTNDLDVDRTTPYAALDKLREDIRSIITSEKFGYKTLVIDSMDWLEKLIHLDVVEKFDKNIESIAEIPYGRGYETALEVARGILKALSLIQKKHGCHIILLAHASISKYEDPTTEAYDRITPALHVNGKGKGLALEVMEWSDEVLYLSEKVMTRESERGFNQKVTKAVSTGELVLHTRSKTSFDAKSRLTMPDELPFPKGAGWAEYEKYFPETKTKGDK